MKYRNAIFITLIVIINAYLIIQNCNHRKWIDQEKENTSIERTWKSRFTEINEIRSVELELEKRKMVFSNPRVFENIKPDFFEGIVFDKSNCETCISSYLIDALPQKALTGNFLIIFNRFNENELSYFAIPEIYRSRIVLINDNNLFDNLHVPYPIEVIFSKSGKLLNVHIVQP
jgi:hypothetical protein